MPKSLTLVSDEPSGKGFKAIFTIPEVTEHKGSLQSIAASSPWLSEPAEPALAALKLLHSVLDGDDVG